MANTWSVTPSDGVINNNDGSFIFPENEHPSEKIYTITFSSDTCHCSGTTHIIVEGKPQPPECADESTVKVLHTNIVTDEAITIDIGAFFTGYTGFTSVENPAVVNNISSVSWGGDWTGHAGWKNISAVITKNTNSNSRECKFNVVANTQNTSCEYEYIFRQKGAVPRLIVNTPSGKRNPQVIFNNTNGQSEYTLSSYVDGGTFEISWSYGGTVNSLVLSNNTDNTKFLTVVGDDGSVLLNKEPLSGSYKIVTLTTPFNAGDYQSTGKKLTLNFTDA